METLPIDFKKRVLNDSFLGQALLDALDKESPSSVRRNPIKTEAKLPILKEVPWCNEAYYLSERPFYTKDPLFHAGCYYPQEAGSMFLETVLNQLQLNTKDPRILDLCAAPGGKSTLISSWLNKAGLLVSNEVIRSRASILKENMTKWGTSNTVVTSNDPADFERTPYFFDIIVIDAPCSGEGMFRKDPQSRKEWSLDNVDLCAARQRRIVMDVWKSLKPGGFLIYSTCTFNEKENEANIKWFLNELDADLFPISSHQLPTGRDNIGHYGLPSHVDTEGFFIAVIQKKMKNEHIKRQHRSSDLLKLKDISSYLHWIDQKDQQLFQWKNFIFAIPEQLWVDIDFLHQQLKTIKLGVELGEVAKKGLIPNEALALCPLLLNKAIPKLELSHHQSLSYLHGDTFSIDAKIGTYLASYQDEPMGWIKHLGNRFNNLYPKEWRIRMRIDK